MDRTDRLLERIDRTLAECDASTWPPLGEPVIEIAAAIPADRSLTEVVRAEVVRERRLVQLGGRTWRRRWWSR